MKSIPTPSHRNVAKHLIACRGYFRFLILYLNETLQSESGVCLPKRCWAQTCFREALWNLLYISELARGAQGSAVAQWRAAASPRFSLRIICGEKNHRDPQNRGRVIVFRGFVFCSAHLEFHEMSSALFFSDVFSCSIFFWFLKIASDVFFSVCIFF